MKKKFFQINIDKNGPIAGPEMESCRRQCTVCPDALFSANHMKHSSINRKPRNLWFKLYLLILIVENILGSTMQLFLGGCNEKLTMQHPDQWEKMLRFLYFTIHLRDQL